MISVGGNSYNNGINFSANNYSASFETKDDITKISLRKNSSKQTKTILSFVRKIPFLRGFLIFTNSYAFILPFILLLITYEILIKNKIDKNLNEILKFDTLSDLTFLLMYFIILIFAIYTLYFVITKVFKNIKSTWQYHGAEHKVIMTNDENKIINLKNSKKSSRIHDNCGTMLVSIMIFIFMIIQLFSLLFNLKPIVSLCFLITLSISYELFLLKRDTPIISLIFKLGYFLQKHVFTLEPDDFKLKQAIETFKILEAAETGKIATEELEELLKNGKTISNKDIIANNY